MEEASFKEWLRQRIQADGQWFHRIELAPDLTTPGWDDPARTKLPYFGIPKDMGGMRVLDVGCCEGFFSFEAERRGAREVVAIDAYPAFVRRFNWCRDYLGMRATAHLTNVYDLDPVRFGTFDVVFFFGVLYHLRNPLLALERILSVCTGSILMQTFSLHDDDRTVATLDEVCRRPMAKFYPFGRPSGPDNSIHDPTVFWVPNVECARDMLLSTGFQDVEAISRPPAQLVFRAKSPNQAPGRAPDEAKVPWC